jgi:hypothetical protein
MQVTQSGKPSAKRAHRANRPVLVTEKIDAGLDEPTKQAIEEAMQPEIALAAETGEPVVERKRRPGFFANIGRTEKDASEKKADPQAARMARAMRGKSVDTSKEKEQVKEKKAVATSSSARSGAAPARPRSGFKMRYIMGMMAYLLIADFLGVWITNWMVANKLDGVVFTIGSFRATRSTLVFLALLIVILVVMARLDLIPRSLRAMSEPSTPRNANTPAKKAPTSTFETKPPQPTVKQGVKGEHDDLYQEYRANRRYFQKRDRKR